LVCDDGGIFLGWLRHLLPAVRKCVGNFHGAMQMNHEDSDSDLFGDLILTAVAIFFFILLVIGIGLFVWWLL